MYHFLMLFTKFLFKEPSKNQLWVFICQVSFMLFVFFAFRNTWVEIFLLYRTHIELRSIESRKGGDPTFSVLVPSLLQGWLSPGGGGAPSCLLPRHFWTHVCTPAQRTYPTRMVRTVESAPTCYFQSTSYFRDRYLLSYVPISVPGSWGAYVIKAKLCALMGLTFRCASRPEVVSPNSL